jgi:hypothetical protein
VEQSGAKCEYQPVPIRVWMRDKAYEAEVLPSAFNEVSWHSDGPMTGTDLLRQLLDLGFHQQDVVDAMADADPTFLEKLNRGDFNADHS